MATWAVLEGEDVVNHIVADTKETAEETTGKTCVETFIVQPGWKYIDGKFIAGKFIAPIIISTEETSVSVEETPSPAEETPAVETEEIPTAAEETPAE